jgi:hypothetical protein
MSKRGTDSAHYWDEAALKTTTTGSYEISTTINKSNGGMPS